MAFANNALSLSFHADKVVVLHLEKGLSKTTMQAGFAIDLTPAAGFYAEAPDAIAAAIRQRLQPTSSRPDRLLMAIPRTAAIVQNIVIPLVSERDIRQIMQYELERHIPTSAADYHYDVLPQGQVGANQMAVLLVAVHKKALERYEQIAHHLGLPVQAIELRSTAQMNAYRYLRNGDSGKRIILVNLDEAEVDYSFFQDNKVLYTRTMPKPAVAPDGDVTAAIVEQVMGQVRMAERQVRGQTDQEPVNALVLCGPGAADTQLGSALYKSVGLMPVFLNPLQEMELQEVDFKEAAFFSTAVGLSLREFGDRLLDLNLLPVERRHVPKRQGVVLTGVLLGVISALLITMVTAGFLRQNLALSNVNASVNSLDPRVQSILKTNEEYKRLQEQLDIFRQREMETPTKLEILLEYTRILPDGADDESRLVWLTSLDIKNDEATIRGKSERPEELIQLLEDSTYFENVRFDTTGITKQGFVIKMNLSKRSAAQVVDFNDLTGEPEEVAPAREEEQAPPPGRDQPPDMAEYDGSDTTRTQRALPGMQRELPPDSSRQPAQEDNPDHDDNFEEGYDEEYDHGYGDEYEEEPVDIDTARENLFDFLRRQRENQDAPRGTPPPGARSFIEFLQRNAGGGQEEEYDEEGMQGEDEGEDEGEGEAPDLPFFE
ncbi:pilus assembly protein PilM [bacterium]|nr:pilus assembly protein PilM [candidate division CSSED10-310 bacterium]